MNDTTNEPIETDDEVEQRCLQLLRDAETERQRQYTNARRRVAVTNQRRYQRDEGYRKYIKVANAKRDAIELALPHNYSPRVWSRCLDYFNHCCAVCGRPAGLWHFLANDHWIALTDPRPDNPGTVPWNIVPLCHARKDGEGCCNNSKSNLIAEDWLLKQYSKRKAGEILKRINAYFEWVKQQE